MIKNYKYTSKNGYDFEVTIGKYAEQANGACFIQSGDTSLLVTAVEMCIRDRTSPESIDSIPPIILSRVDLPDPEGPKMQMILPFSMSRSIFFKTSTFAWP